MLIEIALENYIKNKDDEKHVENYGKWVGIANRSTNYSFRI